MWNATNDVPVYGVLRHTRKKVIQDCEINWIEDIEVIFLQNNIVYVYYRCRCYVPIYKFILIIILKK